MTTTATQPYTIDAAGKKLGRIASEAALVLRGKNDPSFTPHHTPTNKVHIINASQVVLEPKKLAEEYVHHTGYMGGIKRASREKVIAEKGYKEVFTRAVYNMIPNNKLRKPIMKNLTVTE